MFSCSLRGFDVAALLVQQGCCILRAYTADRLAQLGFDFELGTAVKAFNGIRKFETQVTQQQMQTQQQKKTQQ